MSNHRQYPHGELCVMVLLFNSLLKTFPFSVANAMVIAQTNYKVYGRNPKVVEILHFVENLQ